MANNNEHELSDSAGSDNERLNKRRRLQGACAACRRKKIKCDRSTKEDKICSNCVNSRVQCQGALPRTKEKDKLKEYIRKLEERLRTMEHKLQMRHSDSQTSTTTPTSRAGETEGTSTTPGGDTNPYPSVPLPLPLPVSEISVGSTSPPGGEGNGDVDDAHIILAERLKSLSMSSHTNRFFGQSSMMSFAQQVVVARQESEDTGPPSDGPTGRREYFWSVRNWEHSFAYDNPPVYTFPEPDLLDALVNIFFERIHIVVPAVHRQSFERSVRHRVHLSNPQFGMVVLAVCALASRHSEDPRVFLNEADGDGIEGSSAGWKYITQVPLWRNTLCDKTTAYDMQFYALATIYYMGTSMPQICWFLAGLGLRLAIDRGLHRRKGPNYKPNVEDEAEKRAFWCLVACDRMHSSFLGRPSALHDEDIDCDYPIECDDEYWEAEDPSEAFKQPPGKPCYATSFIYHLKLCEILGFMSRTLYSIKKSKVMTGLIGEDWETRVVTELDSSLNKWKHSLPPHLAWDPSNPDFKLFNQSLVLHSTFYFIQIQVHRPFMNGNCPLAPSSFAICTNAARACSHLAEAGLQRQQYTNPNVAMATFLAAMILAVNFWSPRKMRITYDPTKEMADIERCRAFMLQSEKRWYLAGRLRDIISEFSYVRRPALLEVPWRAASQSNKRNRLDLSSTQAPNFFTDPIVPPAVTASSLAATGTFTRYMPKISEPKPMALSSMPISVPVQPSLAINDRPQTNLNQPVEQWDLRSLLLAQMGYDQPLGNNFPVPVPETVDGSLNRTFSIENGASITPTNTSNTGPPTDTSFVITSTIDHGGSLTGYNYADPLIDMSMWMSAPTSVSLEEWDEFIGTTVGPSAQ